MVEKCSYLLKIRMTFSLLLQVQPTHYLLELCDTIGFYDLILQLAEYNSKKFILHEF